MAEEEGKGGTATTTEEEGKGGAAGGTGEGTGGTGAGSGREGTSEGVGGAGEAGAGSEAEGKAAREAQDLRRRLREAEERTKRLQQERESDSERMVRERDEAIKSRDALLGDVRTLALETTVARLAPDLGLVDPLAACRLLDGSKVEYDDSHRPSDRTVKEALKDAIARHPFLTRSGDADGGRKREAKGGKGEMDAFIRGK